MPTERTSNWPAWSGLSPAATLHRVRSLKESGVIRIIPPRLDPAAAGFPLQLYVAATLGRHDPRATKIFEDQVRALPQIISADNVAGEMDYSSPSSPGTSPNSRRCWPGCPPGAASG